MNTGWGRMVLGVKSPCCVSLALQPTAEGELISKSCPLIFIHMHRDIQIINDMSFLKEESTETLGRFT